MEGNNRNPDDNPRGLIATAVVMAVGYAGLWLIHPLLAAGAGAVSLGMTAEERFRKNLGTSGDEQTWHGWVTMFLFVVAMGVPIIWYLK